ncbi:uncharacterized protein PgNI_04046 [Pyricularia grisea]|uniref:Uncharacterized protein n=1 Tax=Pyricularia grisea TaxID=148305 RepID=A0A6P8BCM1_PYRGI|nr:uncharacterized protein PgNI_04046 [Pyricularia grisea]TLD13452.1 hypothetical protein PgNI_04046 [Pyricularia grisea]
MTNVTYGVARYIPPTHVDDRSFALGLVHSRGGWVTEKKARKTRGLTQHTLNKHGCTVYPETRLCLGSVQVSLEFRGVTSFELRTATEQKRYIVAANLLSRPGFARPAGFRSPYVRIIMIVAWYKIHMPPATQRTWRALHTRLLPAPMTAVVSGNRDEASGVYHSARPPPHANVGPFSPPLETRQLRHT